MVRYSVLNRSLLKFISRCKLIIRFKNVKIDLMDSFPKFKEGVICSDCKDITFGSLWNFFNIYNKINDLNSLKDDKLYQKYFNNYVCLSNFISDNTHTFKYRSGYFDLEEYIYEMLLLKELNQVVNDIHQLKIANVVKTRPLGTTIVDKSPEYYTINTMLQQSLIQEKYNIVKILTKNIDVKLMNSILCGGDDMVANCLGLGACPFIGYSMITGNKITTSASVKKFWLIHEALLTKGCIDDVNNLIFQNLMKFIV